MDALPLATAGKCTETRKGRTMTKTQGSYTATYGYRFGNKLKAAVSNFPGEPTPVQPNYDGFGRLRSVSVNNGASVWKYRWAGNQMLSEYDDTDGTWEIEDSKLIYTYVHDPDGAPGSPLADLAGTNPSTGTPRYYSGDNLGSTRRLRAQDKSSLGQYEYQPYGEVYAQTGVTPRFKFAGMCFDSNLGTYYTVNRFYSAVLARWTTRDPSGMDDGPNQYPYAGANPISFADPLGLFRIKGDCGGNVGIDLMIREQVEQACANLEAWVSDARLRKCVARRCEKATIKCHQCKRDCDRLGWNRWVPWGRRGRSHTAHVCASHENAGSQYDNTVIHEWVHSCGYHRQDPPWNEPPPWGDEK
jgi:RHS repeat-associated protein